MKHHHILFLILLLPFLGNAQDDYRSWWIGPLTWRDFQTVDSSRGDEHSFLEFYLDVEPFPEEHNGVNVWMEKARAGMDRKKSWVDTNYKDPNQLLYNQVIFNMVELHRRYMQVEIDSGGTPDVNEYMTLLVEMVDEFCDDSQFGNDTAIVSEWDAFVRDHLAAAAAVLAPQHAQRVQDALSPESYTTVERFGVGIGGGLQIPTGNLSQYVRTGGGFYMDCEFGAWRHIFNFGLYMGGSDCKQDASHKYNKIDDLLDGDDLTVLDFKLDYGFAAIDNYRFRLMPFVGIGLLGYFYSDGDDESHGPSAFDWRAGLDFRYHFSSDVTRYSTGCEVTQISLFAKIYVSPTRFNNVIDEPHGTPLTAVIGIAFHESTRVRKPILQAEQ